MKILLLNFACLFCLTALVFGEQTVRQGRIAGGEECLNGVAPYIASLRDSKKKHFCAGVIITPEWILTTARCIIDGPERIWAATGSVDRVEPRFVSEVKIKVNHKDFNQAISGNDIGLLKLMETITFDLYTQPIPMAANNNLRNGDKLHIAGWGKSRANNKSFHRVLRVGVVDYLAIESCWKFVRNYNQINEGVICTDGRRGVFSAHGDAGGPLIGENCTLVGIISWGLYSTVDIHTSVPYHLNWIQNVMADFSLQ